MVFVPSPAFALNGGAVGLKASVTAAGAVVATLDSTTSVSQVEWDIIGTDETSVIGDYTLVQSGPFGETVTTTALAAGTAAILRCRINNGIGVNGNNDPSSTIATAKFFVPLADGGEVGCKDETYESDATYGSTGILNGVARRLAVVPASVASVTGNAPLSFTGGLNPVGSVAAASGAVPGSMSAAHYTKLEGLGAGATIVSVGVTAPITNTGTATAPVFGASAATALAPGSQSAAHYSMLEDAATAATANKLSKRGPNGEISYSVVTADAIAAGSGSTAGSKFGSSIALTPFTDPSAASITFRGKDGGRHEVTITEDTAFPAPILFEPGASLEVFLVQDVTGGWGATWASGVGGFYFPVGISGTPIASAPGDADYYEFKHRSTPSSHWVCVAHLKYSPP
jgi:hypothetical protein